MTEMIRKIAQYRVKSGAVEDVREAIQKFVDAVAQHEPDTIYGALVADDGTTFIHCMAFPTQEAEEHHRTAAYTKRFVEELYPNCEEEPVFTTVEVAQSTKRGAGFLGMRVP